MTQFNDVRCCKWKGLHRASTNKLRKRVKENAKVLPHPVMARRRKWEGTKAEKPPSRLLPPKIQSKNLSDLGLKDWAQLDKTTRHKRGAAQ